MKKIIFFCLFIIAIKGLAQEELIRNGSFELGTPEIPTSYPQINNCENWSNMSYSWTRVNGDWASWYGPFDMPSAFAPRFGTHLIALGSCGGAKQKLPRALRDGEKIRVVFHYTYRQISADRHLRLYASLNRPIKKHNCSDIKDGLSQVSQQLVEIILPRNTSSNGWRVFDGIVTVDGDGFDWIGFHVSASTKSGINYDDSKISVDGVSIIASPCGGVCCPEYVLYQNTISLPTYTAVSDFIKAGRNVDANVPQGDVIVKSGQDVTFQAANNIFLEDGFSVESGAKFDTRIAPCSSQPFNISVSNELTPCSNKLCVNVCTPPGQSYTISWSNGLGTLPQVEVSPTAPTTYTVTVRNTATGQIRTQSILVTPNYFPNPITFRIIPNVFTPNGDGINDVWRPDDYGKQTFAFNAYRYELEIVDRWGGRVLKEDETNTAPGFADDDIYWNGLKDNEGFELPGGVYYYSLKLYSCLEVKQYNGSISLLRSLGGIANPIEPMNVFDLATSSDQNSQENLIYPNPSTGLVNIQFASNKSLVFKVEVLDNLYKPLIIKHLNSEIGKTELDLAHLPNGIYFIRLISDTETTIRKLIISK